MGARWMIPWEDDRAAMEQSGTSPPERKDSSPIIRTDEVKVCDYQGSPTCKPRDGTFRRMFDARGLASEPRQRHERTEGRTMAERVSARVSCACRRGRHNSRPQLRPALSVCHLLSGIAGGNP